MTIQQLKIVCEQIMQDFSTLLSVRVHDKSMKEEIIMSFKDFSAKTGEFKAFDLRAKILDKETKAHFQINKPVPKVEVYLVIGSCEYDDSTLAKRLIAFSNVLFFLKNIQLITIDHGGQGVLVILRSLIDVDTHMESFSNKLLHAIKGMLSFHYTILYQDTKAKVKETLDDEEMIKNLLDKHTKTIELLLNPEHLESL